MLLGQLLKAPTKKVTKPVSSKLTRDLPKTTLGGIFWMQLSAIDSSYGKSAHLLGVCKGQGAVTSLAFSADERFIYAGSAFGSIIVWKIDDCSEHSMLRGHHSRVRSIYASKCGSYIVSGSDDETVRIWNLSDMTWRHCLQGHNGSVNSVTISQGGGLIISGSGDRTIRIWDLGNELRSRSVGNAQEKVTCVAYNPQNRTIVSGSPSGSLNIIDVSGGGIHALDGHKDAITAVALHHNAMRLITSSEDKTAIIWDLVNKTKIVELPHDEAVVGIASGSSGRYFVTACRNHNIHIWDASTFKEVATFRNGENPIFSIAIDNAFSRLIVGSDNGEVNIWDMSAFIQKTDPHHDAGSSLISIVFPDHTRIVDINNIGSAIEHVKNYYHGMNISIDLDKLHGENLITCRVVPNSAIESDSLRESFSKISRDHDDLLKKYNDSAATTASLQAANRSNASEISNLEKDVLFFARKMRESANADGTRSRFAAVMFIDMVGSTASSQEERAINIAILLNISNYIIGKANVFNVNTWGDGVLAAFDSAEEGLRAACKLSEESSRHNIPIRTAVHWGVVELLKNGLTKTCDISGDVVAEAARYEPLASAGEVIVSPELHGILKQNRQFRFMRHERILKKATPTRMAGAKITCYSATFEGD